ncbi:hypothetical protein PRO82_000568 [Candidatus Protochlamydia amoebophila]|nr:hypothetical protein [Candidatus Protochlamydia amoebophila]
MTNNLKNIVLSCTLFSPLLCSYNIENNFKFVIDY